AFEDAAYVAKVLEHTARERQRLAAGLAPLGFEEIPSRANFASFVAREDCGLIAKELAALGILIVPFAMSDGRPAIRISIGTREDTDAVVHSLAAIPSSAAKAATTVNA
ncbi:MAG: hypothetical protein ABWZ80_00930, partial [Beijerinckiaceae bacterium]